MPANFDLIPTSASLDAATINIPLQQLDNAIAKKNLNSTTNPTANDDGLDGYSVGSIWVNELLGRVFFAVSVAPAAAVWSEIGGTQNNLTALVPPSVDDDDTEGYLVGSVWVDVAASRAYVAMDVSTGAAVWQGFSYPAATLVVDSSGRLILGRATGVSSHGGISAGVQVLSTSNIAGTLSARYAASAFGPQITLAKSRHGTVGSHTVVVASDSLGKLSFEGSDGNDFEVGAEIEALAEGTPANNVMPAGIAFRTTPDASATPVLRMYINRAGRVGIGQMPDATAQLAVTGAIVATDDIDTDQSLHVGANADIGTDLTVTGTIFALGQLDVAAIARVGPNPTFNFITHGLVVDMAGESDDALELQDSVEVAHGATAVADTHTFATLGKVNNSNGGLQVQGLSEGNNAFMVDAIATTEDNTHTSAAVGYMILRARRVNGTGATTPTAGRNTVVFMAGAGAATHIFDSSGNSWEDGTGWTAYDDYDDAALLELVNQSLIMSREMVREQFVGWVQENAASLQRMGLVEFGEDGHNFVNRSGLQELAFGAMRQAFKHIRNQEARLAALEARA